MSGEQNRLVKEIQNREPEYLDLVTKYQDAFSYCHPVGTIGVFSALFVHSKTSSSDPTTDDIAALFGQRNNQQEFVYNWLSEYSDKTIARGFHPGKAPMVNRMGLEDVYQTWQLTDEAKRIHLPELSTLIIGWANRAEEGVNLYRFLERRDAGVAKHDLSLIKIFYLTALYLDKNRGNYPEAVTKFLHAQKVCIGQVVAGMSNDNRSELKKSLIQSGMVRKEGAKLDVISLTPGGSSFVEQVAIPFSALLADEDDFRTNPVFNQFNKALMMPYVTYLQDRKNAKLLLEEFGTKVAHGLNRVNDKLV